MVQGSNKPIDSESTYKENIRSGNSVYFVNCVRKFVLETYEDCKDIRGEYQKKTCIKEASIKKDDAITCAKIEENSCIEQIAIKNNNTELCYFISDTYYEPRCIKEIAVKVGDLELCEKVENYRLRNECKEALK